MLIEEQWGIKNDPFWNFFSAYYKNAFSVIVKYLWPQTHQTTH